MSPFSAENVIFVCNSRICAACVTPTLDWLVGPPGEGGEGFISLPSPVVHPESKELQGRLERRFVGYPHGHVEVIEEDHQLLAAERTKLVL